MKKIDLSDLGGMVYSTGDLSDFDNNESEESLPAQEQHLELYFEKKGRAGKAVCIIAGYTGPNDDLKALAKELKAHCGVGGSVKDGEIILQGKVRDKAMEFLLNQGFNCKRIGG